MISFTLHREMHVRRQFENDCLRLSSGIDWEVVELALLISRAYISRSTLESIITRQWGDMGKRLKLQ